MSMPGNATNSGQFFIGVASGRFSLQNFSELPYVELETATISTSGFAFRADKWRVRTMLPAPTIPIRSLWLFLCIGSVRFRSCKLHSLLCELDLTASSAEAFNQSLIGVDWRSFTCDPLDALASTRQLTQPYRARLCQEFAISQDPSPCVVASFTGVVWPRKKAASVGT